MAGASSTPRGTVPFATLALVLALASQACLLTIPLLTLHVIDGVIETRNLDTGVVLGVMAAVTLAFAGLFHYLRDRIISGVAEALAHNLERAAFETALDHRLPGNPAAGLGLLRDASTARRFLMGQSLAEASDAVFAPVALSIVFILHPALGWLTVAAAAMVCLVAILAGEPVARASRRAADAEARARAALAAGAADVDGAIGLGMQGAMLRHWEALQSAAATAAARAAARSGNAGMATDILRDAFSLALIIAGALLVIEGELSWGAVFATTMLGPMVTGPAGGLAGRLRIWVEAASAVRRLGEGAGRATHDVPAQAPSGRLPGLLLQDLECRTPGGRVAVSGLSLHLQPGSLLLVTGPNGAGKTSLLRVLLGLAGPDAGRVFLDGEDTALAPRDAIGQRIGFLAQGSRLLEGTVLENIGRFQAEPDEVVAAAKAAGAHTVLGRLPLGYASPAGPSSGLSGGQRQAVGLARALLGQPDLIVLDEPEAGLDASGVDAVIRAVEDCRSRGAVIIVATHRPVLWERVPHQVLQIGGAGVWRLDAGPQEAPG